jgi:hypothetical protein
LVWGIIAFFQEGNSWRQRRNQIEDKNKQSVDAKPTSWNNVPAHTKSLL